MLKEMDDSMKNNDFSLSDNYSYLVVIQKRCSVLRKKLKSTCIDISLHNPYIIPVSLYQQFVFLRNYIHNGWFYNR